MKTRFYLPDTDVERLRAFGPDRDRKLMVRGQRWVLQTFLRLREVGMDVERIVEAWRELLEVVVPSLGPPGRRPPYWLRSATRRIGALVHARA